MSEAPPFYRQPGLHVEIYDAQTAAGWGDAQQDIAFYVEEARASGGGDILEIACGTGRLLLPMLHGTDTGEIHGVDLNPPMLAMAEAKRNALPAPLAARLHLHQGDMTRFDLGRKFALVIIAFRSFQAMLTPEAQRSCLESVRAHLAPGGRAILNLFDPRYEFLLPGPTAAFAPPREVARPVSEESAAGASLTTAEAGSPPPIQVETLGRENDPLRQVFHETWRFTESAPDGRILRQEEESLTLRWTFREEFRHLAELCGLHVLQEYSDFHRSPPAYGKEQVWVLAAR